MDPDEYVTTLSDMCIYVQDAIKSKRMVEEYRELRTFGQRIKLTKASEIANRQGNLNKNRYKDVLPFDDNLVYVDESTYVNASYISMPPPVSNKAAYIAAQGPLEHTVNDFWRMIWSNNVHTIVMLCVEFEQGYRRKCATYWPSPDGAGGDRSMELDEFDIDSTDCLSPVSQHFVRRRFRLRQRHTNRVRYVTQWQYLTWPDHDTPNSTTVLLHLLALMPQPSQDRPLLVHCSAGCGRTGIFIAVHSVLLSCLSKRVPTSFFQIAKLLRQQRVSMIQTTAQYEFVALACQHMFLTFLSIMPANVRLLPYIQQLADFCADDPGTAPFRNYLLKRFDTHWLRHTMNYQQHAMSNSSYTNGEDEDYDYASNVTQSPVITIPNHEPSRSAFSSPPKRRQPAAPVAINDDDDDGGSGSDYDNYGGAEEGATGGAANSQLYVSAVHVTDVDSAITSNGNRPRDHQPHRDDKSPDFVPRPSILKQRNRPPPLQPHQLCSVDPSTGRATTVVNHHRVTPHTIKFTKPKYATSAPTPTRVANGGISSHFNSHALSNSKGRRQPAPLRPSTAMNDELFISESPSKLKQHVVVAKPSTSRPSLTKSASVMYMAVAEIPQSPSVSSSTPVPPPTPVTGSVVPSSFDDFASSTTTTNDGSLASVSLSSIMDELAATQHGQQHVDYHVHDGVSVFPLQAPPPRVERRSDGAASYDSASSAAVVAAS